MTHPRPVACVGLVVWKGNEVLLIRRGRPPMEGAWSIPGGKIEFGENTQEAGLRELAEETGVEARIETLLGVYEAIAPDSHYVLIDFTAEWVSGDPEPGDDASEAVFVPLDEALSRLSWDKTRTAVQDSFHARAASIQPKSKGN
jgi:8-oxo-dGTP diphosphatase